jgi:hypothetical protein
LVPVENRPEPEVYRPLEDHPEIARDFAEVVSPDNALRFANQYGLLGYRDMEPEDVSTWLIEASILRRAFAVWDLLEDRNTRGLAGVIMWKGDSVFLRREDGGAALIANWHQYSDWLPRWKRGDVTGPAKLWLLDTFNRKMIGKASPTVLLNAAGQLKPYSTPLNLLASIWVMFGEVITGSRKQRRCEVCPRFMDVTESHRNKRIHPECSLRLRMRRYRASMRRARQLFAAGIPIGRIAEQLDTKPEKIKKWIGAEYAKKKTRKL